jgi:hypothetical protein
MTPENFAYWLQGFFEIAGTDELTETQVKMVKDHLALVFQKVTPDRSKKVKKKKKDVSPLEAAARAVDFDPFSRPDVTCTTPTVNTEQIRINVEDALKKLEQRRREQPPYRTVCTWVGGGRDQKYC